MSVKKQFLALLFLVLIVAGNIGCLNKPQTRKPYIVLLEQNPWLMVVGSDSPIFALYDDGLTIFYDKREGYKSLVLSKKEKDSFKVDKSFYKLKDFYEIVSATDQPYFNLYVWNKGIQKHVGIYGGPLQFEKQFKGFEKDIKAIRSKVPNQFLRIYDNLMKFNNSKAKKWLPEKIEVMLYPNNDSKEVPYSWPKNWPNINTPGTVKREELYSVYLDSSNYDELIKIIKEKSTVLMNKRKWSIFYRFPFPNEELWMKE